MFPPCASPLERDQISSAGSSREIQALAEKEDAEIQLFVRLLFQLLRSSIQLACRDCGRHDDCSITSGFNWWRPCLPLSAGASHFDWFYVRESRPITLARFHSPLFSFLSFLHSLLLLLLFWMRRRLMTWPQRQVADPPERTRWLRFCCYCCCGFIVVDHERRSTNSVVEQQKKTFEFLTDVRIYLFLPADIGCCCSNVCGWEQEEKKVEKEDEAFFSSLCRGKKGFIFNTWKIRNLFWFPEVFPVVFVESDFVHIFARLFPPIAFYALMHTRPTR